MRCQRCGGQKTVRGIGWIEQDCPTCGGTGSVNLMPRLPETVTETLTAIDPLSDIKRPKLARKARGR